MHVQICSSVVGWWHLRVGRRPHNHPTPTNPNRFQMEATERLLSSEQSANKQLRAGADALASDLAAARSALDAAERGMEAEKGEAAALRAELASIKGGSSGGRGRRSLVRGGWLQSPSCLLRLRSKAACNL